MISGPTTTGSKHVRRFAILLLLSSIGCSTDDPSEPAANPLPVLLGVTPDSLIIESGPATLTLAGKGFTSTSQARWNDGDRVTHYQSAQTLTVDLSANDVGEVNSGRLTVVNGGPGGGTSGELTVPLVYPTPKIVSISPSSAAYSLSQGTPSITISGSGFTKHASVRFGYSGLGITSLTSTQIITQAVPEFLPSPGRISLSVSNPTPGGGQSNVVDFEIAYAVPTISRILPDSVLSGSEFVMSIEGTGFTQGSVVRWNGASRATAVASPTLLLSTISAADADSGKIATVTVFNPAPGGGTSNAVPFRVREAPPVITSLSPIEITVGSSATTVLIYGSNFRLGATVQWNGQFRSATRHTTGLMSVVLPASDLTNEQLGKLTVTNPGESGVSTPAFLAIVRAGS